MGICFLMASFTLEHMELFSIIDKASLTFKQVELLFFPHFIYASTHTAQAIVNEVEYFP